MKRRRERKRERWKKEENKTFMILIHSLNHLSHIYLAGIVSTVVVTRDHKYRGIISEDQKERSN